MRFGVLLLAAALAGSVSQGAAYLETSAPSAVPDGAWAGTLDFVIQPDGSKIAGYEFAIATCGGKVQHWFKDDKGVWDSATPPYETRSGPDTHALVFVHMDTAQPGWVETQTFTVLEIDNKAAAVQWSRAVNNRSKASGAPERTFFYYGTGTFQRTRTGCASPAGPPL